MENATDALKMAAAVLIFVLALSISINAFGKVRVVSRTILEYKDKEYNYTYVEELKDDNGNPITSRIVGVETIIPSIYRAYKENYKIVFKNLDNVNEGIYKKVDSGSTVPVYEIDLTAKDGFTPKIKDEFLNDVLYGTTGGNKEKYKSNLRIVLNSVGLYDKIKGEKFIENLGVYYQEDSTGEFVPQADKHKKRIITYTKI